MAAVSAWAKPGAWALDSEEHEAMEQEQEQEQQKEKGYDSSDSSHQSSSDFPSLSAAAVSKTSKKKKKQQSLSLAEFTTGKAVSHGAGKFQPSSRSAAAADPFTPSKGLTPDELLLLPSGPRERTAEELERSSRGFGYSSYGGSGGRGRVSGEDSSNPRWGSSRVSDETRRGGSGGGMSRDSGPSRADEVDDWGATKRPVIPSERRERGGGGSFDSQQSRADESESWISKKSVVPLSSDGRRINGGGFDGPRERKGFEMFNREGSNGGVGSDTWGKKREEPSGGGRPRLVLQPRSLPPVNGSNGEQQGSVAKSKGLNPFGDARPREEVLAEKGQDWKKIDEKLEAVKIQEAPVEGLSFGKKGSGMGNGLQEDRTERAWRKADAAGATLQTRAEKVEEQLPEN